MIKKIKYSGLVSAEFYQFLSLVLGIVDASDAKKLKVTNKRDAFAALVQRLFTALKSEEAYALTKTLEALDKRRDVAISGFLMWIKSLCNHPNKNVSTSAAALKAYLKKYGTNIPDQNQQMESATLSKIVEDLKSDAALKSHLANLKDTEWLPEIETANNLYISNFQQRSTQMGIDANAETFTSLRKPAISAYEGLINLIVGRYNTAIADGVDAKIWQKVIDDINATIDQYTTLIKQTQHSQNDKNNNNEEKKS